MDDLPVSQSAPPQPQPAVSGPVSSVAKEVAPIAEHADVPRIEEVGKDVELPAEVKRAGVTIKADTIVLPKPVAQLGVTPVGPAAPAPQPPTVVLPLTDDQIAQGLNQSIMSSWRWLAEWCDRQLKRTHVLVKTIQGKTVRVSE